MPKIQVLDPHVADLIAAGEVVERPASVVKELTENAVDAGAGALTVEIQNGGMTLIRVSDNGCGISPEDCETAFLPHATSKLRTARDLEAIGTLGFRGEALAAISAVSQVDLFTRTADALLGTSLSLEAGQVLSKEEAGCPPGTTLVVKDLFFNTPARLKFMKRDAAEGAAVFAVVQRLALSHPEVSVKFIRDGKQDLLTPGDGKLLSALYNVLGRDMALGFTPVNGSGEDITVSGFASMPVCCKGTRGYQHFFVNGRQVRSRLLTAALEEAYQNQKMVGKFPGCVLHITTKLNAVDVNVHPAKTEVKFLSEKKMFDAVYYAVLSALTGETRRPGLQLTPPSPISASAPGKLPVQGHLPLHEQGSALPPLRSADAGRQTSSVPAPPPAVFPPEEIQQRPESPLSPPAVDNLPSIGTRPAQKKPQVSISLPATPHTLPAVSLPPQDGETAEDHAPSPWRVAGEILQTYILVEQGDTVWLIDKHAAHERINFDRMKADGYRPMAQSLLTPLTISPPPEEGAVLLSSLPLLEEFGFDVGDFGGGTLAVRQIPFDIDPGQAEAALCEIAAALLTAGTADPGAARDCVLHTMACKAAVKGGQKNSPQELLAVAREVMDGRVKYCPHGRPVAVTLTRAALEKQFKRT